MHPYKRLKNFNLRSAIWVLIARLLERLTGDWKVVGSSPAWEVPLFLSKNSSKNIIITIFTSELAYSYSNIYNNTH